MAAILELTACGSSENQSLSSQVQNSSTLFDTNPTPDESSELENAPTVSVEEIKQILKPLKEYSDLCWKMFPFDLNEEIVDTEQTISAERTTNLGTITNTFYKVTTGDIQTEKQFIAKLDTMLTEKMKNTFLEDAERPFEFSDGSLYVKGRGAGGMGAGMDALYLNSIEYTDENTVVVTVVSLGDKDKWGTSEDIKDTATAVLVKTADGFRIDECDYNTTIDFYFYNEITYSGEVLEL